jgi:hypothetical protein
MVLVLRWRFPPLSCRWQGAAESPAPMADFLVKARLAIKRALQRARPGGKAGFCVSAIFGEANRYTKGSGRPKTGVTPIFDIRVIAAQPRRTLQPSGALREAEGGPLVKHMACRRKLSACSVDCASAKLSPILSCTVRPGRN